MSQAHLLYPSLHDFAYFKNWSDDIKKLASIIIKESWSKGKENPFWLLDNYIRELYVFILRIKPESLVFSDGKSKIKKAYFTTNLYSKSHKGEYDMIFAVFIKDEIGRDTPYIFEKWELYSKINDTSVTLPISISFTPSTDLYSTSDIFFPTLPIADKVEYIASETKRLVYEDENLDDISLMNDLNKLPMVISEAITKVKMSRLRAVPCVDELSEISFLLPIQFPGEPLPSFTILLKRMFNGPVEDEGRYPQDLSLCEYIFIGVLPLEIAYIHARLYQPIESSWLLACQGHFRDAPIAMPYGSAAHQPSDPQQTPDSAANSSVFHTPMQNTPYAANGHSRVPNTPTLRPRDLKETMSLQKGHAKTPSQPTPAVKDNSVPYTQLTPAQARRPNHILSTASKNARAPHLSELTKAITSYQDRRRLKSGDPSASHPVSRSRYSYGGYHHSKETNNEAPATSQEMRKSLLGLMNSTDRASLEAKAEQEDATDLSLNGSRDEDEDVNYNAIYDKSGSFKADLKHDNIYDSTEGASLRENPAGLTKSRGPTLGAPHDISPQELLYGHAHAKPRVVRDTSNSLKPVSVTAPHLVRDSSFALSDFHDSELASETMDTDQLSGTYSATVLDRGISKDSYSHCDTIPDHNSIRPSFATEAPRPSDAVYSASSADSHTPEESPRASSAASAILSENVLTAQNYTMNFPITNNTPFSSFFLGSTASSELDGEPVVIEGEEVEVSDKGKDKDNKDKDKKDKRLSIAKLLSFSRDKSASKDSGDHPAVNESSPKKKAAEQLQNNKAQDTQSSPLIDKQTQEDNKLVVSSDSPREDKKEETSDSNKKAWRHSGMFKKNWEKKVISNEGVSEASAVSALESEPLDSVHEKHDDEIPPVRPQSIRNPSVVDGIVDPPLSPAPVPESIPEPPVKEEPKVKPSFFQAVTRRISPRTSNSPRTDTVKSPLLAYKGPFYSYEDVVQNRVFVAGMDMQCKEKYLKDADFAHKFGMDKKTFDALPQPQKDTKKKILGLHSTSSGVLPSTNAAPPAQPKAAGSNTTKSSATPSPEESPRTATKSKLTDRFTSFLKRSKDPASAQKPQPTEPTATIPVTQAPSQNKQIATKAAYDSASPIEVKVAEPIAPAITPAPVSKPPEPSTPVPTKDVEPKPEAYKDSINDVLNTIRMMKENRPSPNASPVTSPPITGRGVQPVPSTPTPTSPIAPSPTKTIEPIEAIPPLATATSATPRKEIKVVSRSNKSPNITSTSSRSLNGNQSSPAAGTTSDDIPIPANSSSSALDVTRRNPRALSSRVLSSTPKDQSPADPPSLPSSPSPSTPATPSLSSPPLSPLARASPISNQPSSGSKPNKNTSDTTTKSPANDSSNGSHVNESNIYYSYNDIIQNKIPGLDSKNKEKYLDDDDFRTIMVIIYTCISIHILYADRQTPYMNIYSPF